MRTGRRSSTLDYRYYYYPAMTAVCIGLVDTAYLALLHYRNYTDISYSSFCALTRAMNCDTVAQSPWSVLWGVPVALWGLFGYLLYALLLASVREPDPKRMRLWNLLLLLGVAFSAASLYFGTISEIEIHSFCLFCILSYIVSFTLLFYPWIIRRRFDCGPIMRGTVEAIASIRRHRLTRVALPLIAAAFVAVRLFIPHYWLYTFPDPTDEGITTGITDNGHPWIGAKHPELVIEEFTDYQCFQCYKAHYMLRRLIAQYPDRIRLVHYQYPLDNEFNSIVVPSPFHVGSGKMALLAIYASLRGKFWQANDALFKLGRDKKTFNTKMLAKATGLSAGELAMAVQDRGNLVYRLLLRDIRKGMKLGITGTPTFVVHGKVYSGSIPPNILQPVLDK